MKISAVAVGVGVLPALASAGALIQTRAPKPITSATVTTSIMPFVSKQPPLLLPNTTTSAAIEPASQVLIDHGGIGDPIPTTAATSTGLFSTRLPPHTDGGSMTIGSPYTQFAVETSMAVPMGGKEVILPVLASVYVVMAHLPHETPEPKISAITPLTIALTRTAVDTTSTTTTLQVETSFEDLPSFTKPAEPTASVTTSLVPDRGASDGEW